MLQVAEGSPDEISNFVTRLKELSVQAASDTVGVKERDYLNRGYMALKDEIDRITLTTEFNGTRLLIGSKHHDIWSITASTLLAFIPTTQSLEEAVDFTFPLFSCFIIWKARKEHKMLPQIHVGLELTRETLLSRRGEKS